MRRYLIVDDNKAFAENLAEIIADGGDEVAIASSGREALALAGAKRFDALVSDMRMPVMGGAQLVHEVRRIDRGLPAIVITAYTHDDDLKSAREQGLLAVMPKPVPVPRLLELLSVARRDALVALIEDDAQLSDNLSEALRDRGFAALTAASVLEAERLGGVRPFVGLVDLRVPGGPDGEAMKRLAARHPGLPMVVITGVANPEPPLPYTAIFPKPFSTEALLGKIESIYKNVRGERQNHG